jgi:hypothetical protein
MEMLSGFWRVGEAIEAQLGLKTVERPSEAMTQVSGNLRPGEEWLYICSLLPTIGDRR